MPEDVDDRHKPRNAALLVGALAAIFLLVLIVSEGVSAGLSDFFTNPLVLWNLMWLAIALALFLAVRILQWLWVATLVCVAVFLRIVAILGAAWRGEL